MKGEKLLEYSIELSLLTQLFHNKLITENEFKKIKQTLMKEYKITSDLTASVDILENGEIVNKNTGIEQHYYFITEVYYVKPNNS